MKRIKTAVKHLWVKTTWTIANLIAPLYKKGSSGSILLVPAANLDGGFGEDIMVTSFLENFSGVAPVSLFTWSRIEREDYLDRYKKIQLISGMTDTINYVQVLNILKEHSSVYIIGADIMDGTYGEGTSLNRLRILQLANKLGLTTQISGFSVSNNILPEVKNKLFSISKFTKVRARDVESYNRLKTFIPENRLLLTNDLAFICPDIPSAYAGASFDDYTQWVKTVRASNKKIIGVCPNAIQAKKLGAEKYIKDLEGLISQFDQSGKYAFVFLYHDLRQLCGKESDSTISKTLHGYFSSLNKDCFYTDSILNGIQLKGYLSLVDFTLTGRMHLGISGITYGKPMFGIAYANKFEGMLRTFNVNPAWCLVDYTKMGSNNEEVGAFVANFDAIRDNIEKEVPSVKMNTFSNYSLEYV